MDFKLISMPREEIEAIHLATIKVLEKVGVKFPDDVALKALETVGARIDRRNMVAYIPEPTVKEALKHVPRSVILHARDPKRNVDLQDGKVHFCTSGLGAFVYDLRTGERRPSTKEDTANITRIADALPHYDLVQPEVMPCDVPKGMADIYRFEASFKNTAKHISCITAPDTTREEAGRIVEMAACVVGDLEELKKKPIISVHEEPISPLQYDERGTQVIVEYARSGIPISIYSLSMGGGTAPVTIAGQLVVINAELLAAIALIQAINRGNIVLYGSAASIMDMKTGALAFGAPERAIIDVGVVNLARYYGLPSMVSALNTEASMPGSQAAFEKTATTLPPFLAEANVIFGGGTLDSANTYSFEQLVIDDEICGGIMRIGQGFEVNEETLAVDVITKVGIGKHYLGERHTLKNAGREQWFPRLYKRVKKTQASWGLDLMGEHDLAKAAREKVEEILRTHQPRPLDKELLTKIHTILTKAEKRAIQQNPI